MDEKKKYSILGELEKCSGYSMALMTTFNFEIGFFERAVLSRLFAKDVKKVSVFVDSAELTSALKSFDIHHNGSHIGRKYMVNPVEMNGSFHPKVILLLGEKKARLFVGSANLKSSGLASNNEVFNYIDYSSEHPEHLDVIVDAINFFQAINDMSYKLDNALIKEAKEFIYYHRAPANGESYLLHNVKQNLLDQVSGLITEQISHIDVAVPYYDQELGALRALKERFPSAELRLFIQNKYSTFPIAYNDTHSIVSDINTFSKFLDNNGGSSGNFYHGKVFRFNASDRSYILYGSANCTQSALTKTVSEGGNIECDLFEIGSINEFDYFFDNMGLDSGTELSSQSMNYETEEATVFAYRYGVANHSLELHISYSKRIDGLRIMLGSENLKYMYTNDELIVNIEEEYREHLSDIFEISIAYGDKEELLRCWTYSSATLANNRTYHGNRDGFDDFEEDSTGSKFIQDRIKVLKAEATCLMDLQEYKNKQKYINQIKLEQEGEDGETEDFIIDYKIPDEYRYAYKQYKELQRIKGIFLHRFIGAYQFKETEQTKETPTVRGVSNTIESVTPRKRKATSEEKSFEYFIKGRIRGMQNDLYVNEVELEHYVYLVQVIIEVFDKFRKEEGVEDIFEPDYVIPVKIQFFIRILNKYIEKGIELDNFDDSLICKCFDVILENYLYLRTLDDQDEAKKYDFLGKDLLFGLEKNYGLRRSYPSYIKILIRTGTRNSLTLGFEKACGYIEELYGYKDYDMLCHFISERYNGASVYIKGTMLCIDYKTCDIRACLRPDLDVLREINRYSRNVSRIKSVTIRIKNNEESSDHLCEIVHTINVDYHQWKYIETGKDGMKFNSRTQFLGF